MRLSRFAGVAVLVAVFCGAAAPAQAQINITGITNLKNVVTDANGVLTIGSATLEGTLAGIPFTTDITNFVLTPTVGQASCSVLDLELAPIHISLLGLHVDTSSICLSITAYPNTGLLGPLLCDLAGAGGLLDTITGILNNAGFLSGLSDILNQALGGAQTVPPGHHQGGGSVCTGHCRVLDAVLGPLTLDIPLLGVTVHLDNCNNGAVEVCVSATASQGLLGELLCDLSGGGLTLTQLLTLIQNLLTQLGLP